MTIARELANLLNSSGKVEGTKIADDAVDSDHYAATSVDGAHIANNTITATQIAGDTITAAEIAANAVNQAELGVSSVTSTELANNAVIDAKLNTTGTMPAWNGSALTDLPYDVAFTAGFDSDMESEDVEVATYGELVMARAGTFVGETGYADTATSGTTIVTIQKNGTNIYSSSPQFVSSSSMSAGTLSVTTFAVGDRITFKITAIGATPGQGVRFTLKCKV
jgi:hypothetical protein